MKTKLFLFIVLFVFLSSCATLFNKKTTKIEIYTRTPTILVVNNDTVKTNKNKVAVTVSRSEKPLAITVLNDSVTTFIAIKPIMSTAYIANFLFCYGFPGTMIDFSTPKRYDYPKTILLTPENNRKKYKQFWKYNRKGELYFNINFPHCNFYNFSPDQIASIQQEGFFGFSLGVDYYHIANQFFNLTTSFNESFPLPFPAPINYWGEYHLFSTKYISVSNNHKLNRFSFGYGLSVAQNNWYYRNDIYEVQYKSTSMDLHYLALGFVFSSYVQLGRFFNLGFIYRPTFIQPQSNKLFKYEHLMSIDLAYKFRLKK